MTIEQAPQPVRQEPQPTEPQPEPDWKNRYESMLGRFREVNAQLSQANARTEALENMLATTQNQRPAPQTQQTFLTKKDEEEMGPEMIDFVRRAAQEVAAPYQQEIDRLKQALQGTTQNIELNARQRMHTELDTALPSWNQINHSEDFHHWLALQDVFSGVNRKKLLTQAYAQNDTARVLAIFKGFVSETATQRPASLDTLVPTPASAQPVRPTLEELAAPGRARTTATPTAPAEKQIIRTSDVNAFYAAVRQGKYKGREDLQKQHEGDLFAAMQEGRVVQDT